MIECIDLALDLALHFRDLIRGGIAVIVLVAHDGFPPIKRLLKDAG